jgi:Tfp pilus assembly protein PilF
MTAVCFRAKREEQPRFSDAPGKSMLRVDPTLNHIPARREHVVSLYESINQPLVNIPNHGTAPTGAYLLGTRNEHGYYTVFVYLHQPDTRAVIIYVSEPRNLTADQFRVEESEAVRFVESMGFMIDSIHFRQLQASEQDAVIGRVPIFRPPAVTMDLLEVADENVLDRPISDPIFGSIGPGGAEVFRRAGLGNATIPPPLPGMQSAVGSMQGGLPSSIPGQGAPPQMVMSASGAYAPYVPQAGQPPAQFGPQSPAQGYGLGLLQGAAPPGAGGGVTIQPTPGGAMPQLLPQPMMPGLPGSGPKPMTAPDPKETPEALQRLGRLLGAFAFLFAATAASTACKSGGTEATEQATTAAQTQVDVGMQHLTSSHFADAITAFEEALKEAPTDRDALRGTGFAYRALGRLEDAERFYRKAIDSDPKWSIPKNELATILIDTKRCEEAEQLLRAVKEDIFYATPEFADHNLSLALACQGKLNDAVTVLETVVLKRPQFCLGYLTLADLSSQAKRPEKTVQACEDFETQCMKNEKIRSLVTPEQAAMCYLRSGMAHAVMGDVESARTSFMRCQSVENAVGKECKKSLELLPQ